MKSLYARYIEEKTNDKIIETEKGYATYCFTDKNECYIKDVYILPDFRKRGEMSNFGDMIYSIAKKNGCLRILGSVIPSTKNSSDALSALLAYGMVLNSSTNDFILLSKEIN